MTRDEFICIRKSMGLTQAELGKEMDISLRQIQGLENGETKLRRVHILALERITLTFAADAMNWQLATESVRRDAMDVVALFRGKEPT